MISKNDAGRKPVNINIMAQGFYGSICLEDLFTGKIAKGSNGKHYVCLEDLTDLPFAKGKSNGKTYAGIGIWVNDEPDQYQNIASMSLQQTKAEQAAKTNRIYIGNLKQAGAAPAIATPQPVAAAIPSMNDLPF